MSSIITDRHDHGNRTSKVPLTYGNKLILDQISDEEILTAAEQLRDKERADRRQEYECNSIDDTRQGHRKRHPPDKRLHARFAPKISARLQQRMIHLAQGRIDLQHHKGQEVVYHAQQHRALPYTEALLVTKAEKAEDAAEISPPSLSSPIHAYVRTSILIHIGIVIAEHEDVLQLVRCFWR